MGEQKSKREILKESLEHARRQCENIPHWKKSVLDNAAKYEEETGYVGDQKARR